MFRRALILNLVLAAGLGAALLLPTEYAVRESAIVPAFPESTEHWAAKAKEVSETVKETLAKDTGHRRATFYKKDGTARVEAFMVISGADMNASIHRPERCFPAQGLTIQKTEAMSLDLGGNRRLPVKMLDAQGRVKEGEYAGKTYRQRAYYWFVGHDSLTNDHWERTFKDISDRLRTGTNQRWAYVMLSMNYSREADGEVVGREIEGLIKELYPHLHKLDQLAGD